MVYFVGGLGLREAGAPIPQRFFQGGQCPDNYERKLYVFISVALAGRGQGGGTKKVRFSIGELRPDKVVASTQMVLWVPPWRGPRRNGAIQNGPVARTLHVDLALRLPPCASSDQALREHPQCD